MNIFEYELSLPLMISFGLIAAGLVSSIIYSAINTLQKVFRLEKRQWQKVFIEASEFLILGGLTPLAIIIIITYLGNGK